MSHHPEGGGPSSVGALFHFIFCGLGDFIESVGHMLGIEGSHH